MIADILLDAISWIWFITFFGCLFFATFDINT